ncbi:hypothetical protein BJ742DRAFT_811514 [Cladochytrium replicatum]|nr:hypothetical protein BJ742DRAFT_811514 [Cladochytrium replicatum]
MSVHIHNRRSVRSIKSFVSNSVSPAPNPLGKPFSALVTAAVSLEKQQPLRLVHLPSSLGFSAEKHISPSLWDWIVPPNTNAAPPSLKNPAGEFVSIPERLLVDPADRDDDEPPSPTETPSLLLNRANRNYPSVKGLFNDEASFDDTASIRTDVSRAMGRKVVHKHSGQNLTKRSRLYIQLVDLRIPIPTKESKRSAGGSAHSHGKEQPSCTTGLFSMMSPGVRRRRQQHLGDQSSSSDLLAVTDVFCVATLGNQHYVSELFSIPQDNIKVDPANGQQVFVASLSEGFLFDVHDTDDTVSIRLYAGRGRVASAVPSLNSKSYCPSIDSISSDSSGTSKVSAFPARITNAFQNMRRKSMHAAMPASPEASNTSAFQLLGEATLSVSECRGFDKSLVIQSFVSSGSGKKLKERARAATMVGFFVENDYLYVEKVEEKVADYLDIQLTTPSVLVWRKYWAVVKGSSLDLYDFEYKTTKPRIASINLKTISAIAETPYEMNCAPNCFQITLRDWSASDEWLSRAVDKDSNVIYMCPRSPALRDAWITKLSPYARTLLRRERHLALPQLPSERMERRMTAGRPASFMVPAAAERA